MVRDKITDPYCRYLWCLFWEREYLKHEITSLSLLFILFYDIQRTTIKTLLFMSSLPHIFFHKLS